MSQNVHPPSLAASLTSAASEQPAIAPSGDAATLTSGSAKPGSTRQGVATSIASRSRSAPSLAYLKTPRNLRWIRACAVGLFLFSLAAVLLTLNRNLDFRFKHKTFVGIGAGCFQIGYNEDRYWFSQQNAPSDPATAPLLDLAITPSWYLDWTLAWRPFRVKTNGSTFLVAPLWPVVLSSIALAAWSHGRLSGLRAARTTSCQACGYDLTGIAPCDGHRICPECGKSHIGAEA